MRIFDTILAVLSGAGLILVSLVCVYGRSDIHKNPQQLESLLLDLAVMALDDAGLDWVRVRVDGQTAYLSGLAPTPQASQLARDTVRQAAGEGGVWRGGLIRVEDNFARSEANKISQIHVFPARQSTVANIEMVGSVHITVRSSPLAVLMAYNFPTDMSRQIRANLGADPSDMARNDNAGWTMDHFARPRV